MLRSLKQILAILEFSLATIMSRLGVTMVAVVGIAAVSLVLVSVIATGAGFQRAFDGGGDRNILLMLKASATSELGSNLSQSEIGALRETISAALGRAKLMSEESYFITQLKLKSRNVEVNVPVRGLGQAGHSMRRGFHITAGRLSRPGTWELIVGSRAVQDYAGLQVNSLLQIGNQNWMVVGIFKSDNEVSNSELWGDTEPLQLAYSRAGSSQSVYLRLTAPEERIVLEQAMAKDKRLQLQTKTESEYYDGLSRTESAVIVAIGYVVAAGMGCVAIFVLLGSMQSAVAARSRQIGILRALGFGVSPIFVSVLFETIVISILGGLVGGVLSYLLFNGSNLSTLNLSGGFTQVPFSVWVNERSILEGTSFSALLGLLAGLFPAWGATRRTTIRSFGAA